MPGSGGWADPSIEPGFGFTIPGLVCPFLGAGPLPLAPCVPFCVFLLGLFSLSLYGVDPSEPALVSHADTLGIL